jgi:uncharacterized protein (DUF58 family)
MTDGVNPYLDPKTLDKIRRLDIRARLVVEGFITGQHRSPYNGFAVEFASHREYTPGDDVRHIDWKVWSKTDRYFIKEYEEETNLKCTLMVDASKSMAYGAPVRKFDYAATSAACLAWLLQHQQDAVGLVTFDTKVTRNLPPSSHPVNLKQMLHELEQITPDSQTDVHDVFPALARQMRQRGLVILFSDLFMPLEVLATALQQFRLRRHEVVVMHVLHEDELSFPFSDNTLFRGLESEDRLYAEPRALKRSYLEAMERFRTQVRAVCAANGIDYVLLSTAEPLDAALAGYLAFRQKTRRLVNRRS